MSESELTEVIRSVGKPEPDYIGNFSARRATEEVRHGIHAWRFPVHGRDTKLTPPIDWNTDPHGDRSWRYQLHTLQYLEIACRFYEGRGDLRALEVALGVATDWADQHLDSATRVSEFAWYDMAAGIRAPLLAYLLRAGLWEQRVDEPGVELLSEALQRHGEFLADPDNYYERHNHGLFQDRGLLGMCRLAPFLDRATEWCETARARFARTLSETVDEDEGVHLEHSPAYHFTVLNLVREVGTLDDTLSTQLAPLRSRMEETAGWLVMPSGRFPPVGDSLAAPAPTWAHERSQATARARAFVNGGYAAARHDDGYLLLSAGYHGQGHKHADELSFVLEERGTLVITEAGRHSYAEDHPARTYARSAFAHNTLAVDGTALDWRSTEPYGSGVLAAGSAGPLLAVQARNPVLQLLWEVEHRRTLVYWPHHALLVVDEVRSAAEHAYTRRFHFGPNIHVASAPHAGVEFAHDELAGCLVDPSHPNTRVELFHADTSPYAGWYFPRENESFPIWTVALHNEASSACLVALLTLRASGSHHAEARRAGSYLAFDLGIGGHRLAGKIERQGTDLHIMLT